MALKIFLLWTAFILGGYFLGGIMFSELLPKIFLKKDIRELREDKNPGASNVFINCGVFMGSLCLLLDMAKGFLPVFVGIHFLDVNDPLFAAVMVSPVIGHAISPYHRFRGGKCIATAGGVLIAMLPVTYIGLVLPAAYILFSIVFKIPSHRYRSITVFLIFGVVSGVYCVLKDMPWIALGFVLISSVVIIKHTRRFCVACEKQVEEETEKAVR